jgi:long-chain acyl-CoA synthetase
MFIYKKRNVLSNIQNIQEIVKAVLQLREKAREKNPKDIKQEVTEYCRENMAPYKVPKIIEIVNEIPLTAVGKVDKKALR